MVRFVWKSTLLVLAVSLAYGGISTSSKAAPLNLSLIDHPGVKQSPGILTLQGQDLAVTAESTNGSHQLYLPIVVSSEFEVNPPSSVAIGTGQAFDRCYLPSLALMQAWWEHSPYSIFNVYMGGVSFACPNSPVDASWISSAAQQGWAFIPLWVGPQAPRTDSKFSHLMSRNSVIAYQQGRDEADAAYLSAHNLGFVGDKIIYYDLEGYPEEPGNRDAVKSFVRGWVERLHELGSKAGVYGSPCTSFISDWDSITPKPDDVWIAHWYTDKYDPNASVFDTPCLPDTLWPNHQRIKQYSKPHDEWWGSYKIRIDSNVLDGEIYQFPPILPSSNSIIVAQTEVTNATIRDMALVSNNSGWILVDQNLYWTDGFGTEWRDITPISRDGEKILAVHFVNDHQGLLLQQKMLSGGVEELGLLMTDDAGLSWQEMIDNLTDDNKLDIGSASMEFIDAQTGWISIKLQSSGNFSLGRLFATQDGGRSWDERSIPIGEPVRFINPNDGWTAGGPAGDQFYRTYDGGLTWQPVNHPLSGLINNGRFMVGLPQFNQNQIGYLPITLADGSNSRFEVLVSSDGGDTWSVESRVSLDLGVEPGVNLPFSINESHEWWAATTSDELIYSSSDINSQVNLLTRNGLPAGVIAIDFVSDQKGWTSVQEGTCRGQKVPFGGVYEAGQEPLSCTQLSQILATQDGGKTWYDITPNN